MSKNTTMKSVCTVPLLVMLLLSPVSGSGRYDGWVHAGSIYVLTTPEGVNLPSSVAVQDFPLLVRLQSDFFDFSQADAHGDDLRFSSAQGEALAYQIEEWDAVKGTASVWVRIPTVQGNSRQEIKLHWGRSDAKSESNGKAVFNDANGHLGVFHMDGPVKDVTGALVTTDGVRPRCRVGSARRDIFPAVWASFAATKSPVFPAVPAPTPQKRGSGPRRRMFASWAGAMKHRKAR